MEKYVWLNTVTGEFSNSFEAKDLGMVNGKLEGFIKEALEESKKEIEENKGILSEKTAYKLIKYECLNDDNFDFNNYMKLR